MEISWNKGLSAFALAVSLIGPTRASGQLTPMPATPAVPTASSMLANPYANPAFNPYLNPLTGPNQDPAAARDAAFFYLLSRQAQGGIGSGMLGGPRANARVATTNRAPKQMTPAAMVPGMGASQFFNSGQGAANGMNSYYGRRSIATPIRRR